MKDFKVLITLGFIGLVVCSCSPTKTSVATRASVPPSRVSEEGAGAYSRFIAPPTVRSQRDALEGLVSPSKGDAVVGA